MIDIEKSAHEIAIFFACKEPKEPVMTGLITPDMVAQKYFDVYTTVESKLHKLVERQKDAAQ